MLPILGVAAFALSAVLLFDLVAGARRSSETHQERWSRAMAALSTPMPRQSVTRTDVPADETTAAKYDLAA